MPELPEVETVRRMLAERVLGRVIRRVTLSGLRLRAPIPPTLPRRLRGRRFEAARRIGKYLLIDLDRDLTLISHLGMSGAWRFEADDSPPQRHVHVRISLAGGGELWFEDPRRFGLVRLARTGGLERDPVLRLLGPDPIASPPRDDQLLALARGARVSIKNFLLDQRRVAGLGNIYVSEILHRAGVDPRLRAGRIQPDEWRALAGVIPVVLEEAIERSGTTFSMYRTVSGQPGRYGERLRVYERAGEPCRTCGTPIRRIVQGQRSTYFCPRCQSRARNTRGTRGTRATAHPVRGLSRRRTRRGDSALSAGRRGGIIRVRSTG
jgi:formamidopyrimidine-DNA glycosylase